MTKDEEKRQSEKPYPTQAGPVEGSLSGESGIFTHESADTRQRQEDTEHSDSRSHTGSRSHQRSGVYVDPRAGVCVPRLTPVTNLKTMPSYLSKSTANLALMPDETSESGRSSHPQSQQGNEASLNSHTAFVSQDVTPNTSVTFTSPDGSVVGTLLAGQSLFDDNSNFRGSNGEYDHLKLKPFDIESLAGKGQSGDGFETSLNSTVS